MDSKTSHPSTVELLAKLDQLLLMGQAAVLANIRDLSRTVDELVNIDGVFAERGVQRPFERLEALTLTRLSQLWESGWQPLDLAHAIRRSASPRAALLLIVAMHSHLEQSPYQPWTPIWWREQVDSLVATLPAPHAVRLAVNPDERRSRPFSAWKGAALLSMYDLLEDALLVLGNLRSLRPASIINEPPSRWERAAAKEGRVPGEEARPEVSASSKTLATIRSLLAKAEATTFPAEAESFAEKAQELMTRHSIDVAMLDERHGSELSAGVTARRFHLDQPYAKEKVVLLTVVGLANGVRVVYDGTYAMANAVGFSEDIEVTDMLFTSLLVQAAQAVSRSAHLKSKSPSRPSHQSSAAYRRAFWLSYASRIGERLDEAKERATAESHASYGAALVPVLQERSEAVDAKVAELFVNVKTMKARTVDAEGWWAGRDAADEASLGVARGRLKR